VTPVAWTGDVVCPHCGGQTGSCHLCVGVRRVLELVAERAVANVWALHPRCCEACRRAGARPESPVRGGRYDVAGFVGGGELGDY
jgi:hypothetical protein